MFNITTISESADSRAPKQDVRRVFLRLINHELRTPLSIIINNTNLLEKSAHEPLSVRQTTSVRSINRNAHLLLKLFELMIDYADIQSVATMPDMKTTLVGLLCRTVLAATKEAAQAKSIRIEYVPIESPLQVWGNAYYLTRALTALVANAIAFTPAEGQIGVDVALNVEQNIVLITIWDSGIGIPHGLQQRIFEPFFQIDSSYTRQHNGLGLGLALTERVIELHGGVIRVESDEGIGSRFTVALPVVLAVPSKS